jgi:hypothetical protein
MRGANEKPLIERLRAKSTRTKTPVLALIFVVQMTSVSPFCSFLQNKKTGVFEPFESLNTHLNKKLASPSFSARRALTDRSIRL